MTNSEEYEKALNDSLKAYRNAVKDNKAAIPQGYGVAFNYGYTFGMQQAKSEQKESAKREIDFQREHIATAAMQGLLSNEIYNTVPANLAKRAVEYADALINELNKKKDENNQ